MGRTVRSGLYLAEHFAEVPLLLIGFGRTRDGSGIYPALQNAMLAARAEGHRCDLDRDAAELTLPTKCAPSSACRRTRAGHARGGDDGLPARQWGVGARKPVHEVAARNSWQGDLGFTVPAPLWPR